ncbi:enoyl-CoA hydratase [uncultured Corynebacterium sp.]|uniref:enoyl-CoA hydratase n=1 Tax=uncultured Corynebacterium sp. TaxID=159447 RepID=UPI0026098893|nr:enoyl-CoA hydratase [uncultured Corynebacterium sp.]
MSAGHVITHLETVGADIASNAGGSATPGSPALEDVTPQVGVITLNRPEKRNALNAAIATAVAEAVRAHTSAGVRAILIRGEGPVFCAGADLSGGVYADDFWSAMEDMLSAIQTTPVPVIADIHGPAVGAGCQIAVACDLRAFADEGACWVPVAEHGFALDLWTHARARELMGGALARNVFLAGARVGAEQARATGFSVVLDDATPNATALAHRVARQAPLSMEHSKRVFNSPDMHADAELQQMMVDIWASEDVQEARRARAEKRAPQFRGR